MFELWETYRMLSISKIKELTDKQKLRMFEKEGFSIHYIENKYEICSTFKRLDEVQDLIFSYYLHIFDCCSKCKKKIYRQRYKIKKKTRHLEE